jgi:hypothetical protein
MKKISMLDLTNNGSFNKSKNLDNLLKALTKGQESFQLIARKIEMSHGAEINRIQETLIQSQFRKVEPLGIVQTDNPGSYHLK